MKDNLYQAERKLERLKQQEFSLEMTIDKRKIYEIGVANDELLRLKNGNIYKPMSEIYDKIMD